MSNFRSILLFILFYLIITFAWKLYELITFGKVTPDIFDSIIALILSLSLLINVMLVKIIREDNKKEVRVKRLSK